MTENITTTRRKSKHNEKEIDKGPIREREKVLREIIEMGRI